MSYARNDGSFGTGRGFTDGAVAAGRFRGWSSEIFG